MLLDDDLNVIKSVEENIKIRKKLYKGIKQYVFYKFSQSRKFVQNVFFRNISTDSSATSFEVETKLDIYLLYSQNKEKFRKNKYLYRDNIINKVILKTITDDLVDLAYNYIIEHNLRFEDYKIEYKETWRQWK